MRRREFLGALGGVAAAWPLATRAQQGERVRRVGVLLSLAEDDPEGQGQYTAFVQGIGQLGWNRRANINVDPRWAAGDQERLRAYAAELVGLRPDVILLNGTPALRAVQAQTQTIPIVFVNVAEPARNGLVESLSRPGGHITGFTNYEYSMGGKWLETLKEIAPGLARSMVLFNSENPTHGGLLQELMKVAPAVAVQAVTFDMRDFSRIDEAIGDFASHANGGLIVLPDLRTTTSRIRIIELGARYRLPGIFPFRSFAVSGGLVVYGVDSHELFGRGAASYVDRILRGAKPGDLPVQAPTKFELVVNLKTARALGLTVPPTLLARADEVIE